jgi:hypothetical protein
MSALQAQHERRARLLRQDVIVRDAYIARLRLRAEENDAALMTAASRVQALERELETVHDTAARTLALPRYRLADGINRRLRALGPIHPYAKQWAAAMLRWRR